MATVQIKNSHLGDWEPLGIEKKLFELFKEYLQPSSTASPGAAALEVNDLFPSHRSEDLIEGELEKESPGGFLWELWSQLFDIAGQLPHDSPYQERLAEFVKALSTIQTSTTVPGSNITLWESLPSMAHCAREEVNTIDCEYQKDGPEFAQDKPRRENFYAFVARLTRDGTFDFSLFAIWILRVALEAKPDHRARAYHWQGPHLDFNVPVAAYWISLAGAKLFASNKDFGRDGQGERLWKGKGGFCKERWNLWKSRFKEISEFEQPSQNTRDIAKRAAEDMEKIENQAEGISLFEVD